MRPVHIGEPEVQIIAAQLIQRIAIDAEGVGHVFCHVPGAKAQVAGYGVGLKVLIGRGCGVLGKQRVVKAAGLGGHHGDLTGIAGDLGHVRIAGSEVRRGIVRSAEGDGLDRAALVPGVYQHGGEVVGPVGGETGYGGVIVRVGRGGLQVSALYNVGVVGGLQQVRLPHGPVGHGGKGPVKRSGFIGAHQALGGGGGQIGDLRIARKQPGVRGRFRGQSGVHDLAVDVGVDAGTDHDGVGQHLRLGAGGVHVHLVHIARAGDSGAGVQIQYLNRRAIEDGDGGPRRRLVHGQGLDRALCHGNGGLGRERDNLLEVARGGQGGSLFTLYLDAGEAVVVFGGIFHIGGRADRGVVDLGAALRPDGDHIVCQIIQNQCGGGDAAEDHTVFALFALTCAAHHDLAQYIDVFQRHVAKSQAARDIQISGNGGVFQGHAGGGDGDVSVNAAQRLCAGFVDGSSDGIHQQDGHLAAGDALLGPEGPVAVAVEDALDHGTANKAPAVVGQGVAVGEIEACTGVVVQRQVAAQKHRRLLPCDGVLGRGGVFAGAVEIAGGVADVDIVVIPVGGLHIPERDGGAGIIVAEGSVHQHHEFPAGQRTVRVEVAGGITPHHAPAHQLFKIGLHPVRGGGGDNCPGKQGYRQDQREHGGQQPRSDAARVDSVYFHSENSFLN